MAFRQVHRWISLTVAAFWLVQAITGTLSVFRWEIDDLTVAGENVPVDLRALGAKIDGLAEKPDTSVSSVWTSGTKSGRFDIHYNRGDVYRVMRVDGRGKVLRDRSGNQFATEGAIWDSISSIHTSLMLQNAGEWLIGISGILLLSNILLGLKLAWPKRGTWRKTLLAKPVGSTTAKLYGWHRKVGLWFAFPALLTVTAGVSMVFGDALERGLGAELAEPVASSREYGTEHVRFARAVGVATKTFPGSTFSGIAMPSEDQPLYRVRLRNAGEVPRKWGTTVVWIDARGGRILATYNAAAPKRGRAVIDTMYAVHTGQAGGLVGRILVLIIGLGLLGLIGLGVPFWWKRRRVRKA